MSTCNCDGSTNISLYETLFGDDVLNSQQIFEASFSAGAADPRPVACQTAVSLLKAQGQDACNLDSPDDLQVIYKQQVVAAWQVIQGVPVSNPLQKSADILAGTATAQTPIVSGSAAKPSGGVNYTLIIGFIAVLAIGFFLLFR